MDLGSARLPSVEYIHTGIFRYMLLINPSLEEEPHLVAHITAGAIKYYARHHLHRNNGPAVVVLATGARIWYRYGRVHRDGDLPAKVDNMSGAYKWFKYGWTHRDGDKPAIITPYFMRWYEYGEGTRHGGLPAYMLRDNIMEWNTIHGYLHRDDDKPALLRYARKVSVNWYTIGRHIRYSTGPRSGTGHVCGIKASLTRVRIKQHSPWIGESDIVRISAN